MSTNNQFKDKFESDIYDDKKEGDKLKEASEVFKL